MLVRKSTEREWAPTQYAGVERCLFRNNDIGGRTSVLRMAAGSRVAGHWHEGSEEIVVLAGRVTIGGVTMDAGDYMFTEPGEEHDVIAVTDTVLFISTQKTTRAVET